MNIWKALLWTLIFQASSIPLILFFYSFKYVLGIENENLDYFLNFGSFISLLFGYFIIWWFLVRKNVDFTFEQKDKPNYSLFLIISLIFIGLYFSERPFINLYNDLFYNKKIEHKNWPWKEILKTFTIIDTIQGVLVAPIFEELFFRKFIFSKMLKKYKVWNSIIFSSLCFALIHLPNYRQAIGSFIFGIIACYIFYKTRNIYYSIFLHFIYNFSYYFLKYFGADFHNYFISIKYNLAYWLIVTLGITFLIGGLKLFNKYTKETNLKLET